MGKDYLKDYYKTRGGLTAKKIGQWDRAGRVLRRVVTTAPESAAIIYALAERSKDRIKSNIERQSYNWDDLSSKTVKNKEKAGQDPRKLIATGDFLNSIKVVPMGPSIVGVGILPSAKNDRGESLAEIGMLHEFGSENMPARPFFRREAVQLKAEVAAALSKLMREKIDRG